MAKVTLAPRIEFAEFSRIDPDQRIVEGYCFVNEDAGDGWIWERAAMEAATEDYLQFGAIREMHSKSAVGTANNGVDPIGVTWDERGARVTAKISDDAAWKKVEDKVYKGFSCGIAPTKVVKNRVKGCVWPEISLVDRPQDKDALIDLYRAAETELQSEYELEEDIDTKAIYERGEFAEYAKTEEPATLWYSARNWLDNILWNIRASDDPDKAGRLRLAFSECADYLAELLPELKRINEPTLTRAEHDSEVNEIQTRLEAANSTLLERDAEIERLKKLPLEKPKAVKSTGFAIEREFVANQKRSPHVDQAEALRSEYTDIQERLSDLSMKDEAKRSAGVTRMMVIKQELAAMGEQI